MAGLLLILVVFFVFASTNGHNYCRNPEGRWGECVLLTQCPHLLAALQGKQATNVSQDHVRQSHCGFESIFMPKVCCPIENVVRPAPKCGLHSPGGEQDPWIVLIAYDKADGSRTFLCGGVLIHKRYVLTAAHCVIGKDIPKDARIASVRFGDYNSTPSMDAQIDQVIVHENYNYKHHHNDIALIRLRKKVTFKNGEIRPICLPTNSGKTLEGHFQLAGWEKFFNQSEQFHKRAGIATVWNKTDCHSWYNNTEFRLGETHMCTDGKKKPYLHKDIINFGGILADVGRDSSYSIVGITSSKPSCCEGEEHPKLYTQVAEYVNWIFNNLDL